MDPKGKSRNLLSAALVVRVRELSTADFRRGPPPSDVHPVRQSVSIFRAYEGVELPDIVSW